MDDWELLERYRRERASAEGQRAFAALVERHVRETMSPRASEILRHWDEELPKFRQIVPKEMLNRLAAPLSDEAEAATA